MVSFSRGEPSFLVRVSVYQFVVFYVYDRCVPQYSMFSHLGPLFLAMVFISYVYVNAL
jgi:hypothetical protein